MKFFFIIPEVMGLQWKPLSPHVGIGYLVEVLQQNGHETFVVDMRLDKNVHKVCSDIRDFKPDYIGITGATLGYKAIYNFVRDLKAIFDIPVIIGGPHASTLREQVLKDSNIDMVAIGEGEGIVLDLASGLSLKDIQGLIWRRDNEIITNPPRSFYRYLDNIPFPRYKGFPLDRFLERKIALSTSRSCPHQCTYCCSWLIMGRGFRRRSPQNVLEEIEYWHNRDYRELGINDDEFIEDVKRAEMICDLIIEKKLGINFDLRTGVRIDRINEQLLNKMKKAGIIFTAFGIESIDQEVLDRMKKGLKTEQIIKVIDMMHRNKFPIGGFFMIGLPGDTPDKFNKTYEFASKYGFDEVRFYNTYPYPGTELFDWIKQNGRFLYPPEVYLNEGDRLLDEPVFETDEFSRQDRIKAFRKGEFLMTKLYIIKTIGPILGFPFVQLARIRFIRKFIIRLGFRLTKPIRNILRLKRLIFNT